MLIVGLGICYYFYISQMVFPTWDGALYLENAENWIRNEPLEAPYRPPIISWIIAGIWSITGEDWTAAKHIQSIFTLSAGMVIYLTLKKNKGAFFAFGVAALTMVNSYVLFFSTQIMTEGLSLFFLVISFHFLKSEKQSSWVLAGLTIGLTFGSRYPIFLLAILFLIIEVIIRRDRKKLFAYSLVGIIPTMLLIILAVYIKAGTFTIATERDTELSILLSPFYFENFIRIFGFISLLLPIAFLFRETYIDRFNYVFILWFLGGLLFWSSISQNQQERFMIQTTPATYFLTILAVEYMWNRYNLLTVRDLRDFAGFTIKRTYLAAKRIYLAALRRVAFFPLWYYLCSFVIAYVSLSLLKYIVSLEEQILKTALQFFGTTTIFVQGELHAQIMGSEIALIVPIYVQLIFLIFFPTIAITSRINIKKRIQFLSFGLMCFSSFIMIELLSVFIPSPIRHLTSILITIIVGGLIIELSLWSTITTPKRTKIRRILKRNYFREYLFLTFVFVGSILFTILFFMSLQITVDSPFIIYALLTLSSIFSVGYLLANFIYEIIRQTGRRSRAKANIHSEREYAPAISFLIPAYNEEKIIKKCIESIDKAAARYHGKTEIIVVNDGSTDNTEKVGLDSVRRLVYAHGEVFSISKAGKAFSLDYGLKRTSSNIVIRMDADSLIDKNAIYPMVEHFEDPDVGSVSGFVFPLNKTNIFSRAQNVLFASYFYVKRAQELFDSIIVQPGAFTTFRKSALIKIGGWIHNQFGEDGELTSRMARFGYRSEFEQRSIIYSDSPQNIRSFVAQRSRWAIAYYHSRGRNLEHTKELASPRALIFLQNLEVHGAGFGLNFAWILLAAALLTPDSGFFLADLASPQTFLATLFIKLIGIHFVITAVQVMLYAYALKKVNRLKDIKYYPVMRLLQIILSMWIKILATEAILRWSSKWLKYSDEAFRDLENYMNEEIDPGYPRANTNDRVSLDKEPQ